MEPLLNPNVLVAVSSGTRAVKLCSNRILQFLSGNVGLVTVVVVM